MDYYPQGSLVFLPDPTGSHDSVRPAIVISDINRENVDEECTIVCLSTKGDYSHDVTHLPRRTIENVRLKKNSYIMPWALYTVSLDLIRDDKGGKISDEGLELVADAIEGMIRP